MSVKLKIKVTKEILEQSMYCGLSYEVVSTPENCAVALAVRDIFPKAWVMFEEREEENKIAVINAFGIQCEDTIVLPGFVKEYIDQFDYLKREPEKRIHLPELEFEIEIPEDIIEQINIEELRGLLQNHPTLQLL